MEWVVFEKFEQVGTRPQDVKDAARTDELVVASFLMPLMYLKGHFAPARTCDEDSLVAPISLPISCADCAFYDALLTSCHSKYYILALNNEVKGVVHKHTHPFIPHLKCLLKRKTLNFRKMRSCLRKKQSTRQP
jgi:hypothetical protein